MLLLWLLLIPKHACDRSQHPLKADTTPTCTA